MLLFAAVCAAGSSPLGREMEKEKFTCCICGQPLDLKFSKTDEKGQAVHTDCYTDKLQKNPPRRVPEKAAPNTSADDEEG